MEEFKEQDPKKENRLGRFFRYIYPYRNRLLGMIIGLIVGVSFLNLGFWKTILFVFLIGLGYSIGSFFDGKTWPLRLIERFFG